MIVQICATHFTAGIVMEAQNGTWIVIKAAPIIGYMRGWKWAKVREYVNQKRWQFTFFGGDNAEQS